VTFEYGDYGKGHIPGSVFVDWRTDLVEQGESTYYRIVSPGPWNVSVCPSTPPSCSTATREFTASTIGSSPINKILGFKNVTVYDGSRAELTDYPDLPLNFGN